MSAVTDQISSRGYWYVAIWPEPYVEKRVGYRELEDIMEKVAVRLRGWPVPYVDRSELIRGDEWIGEDEDGAVVAHYEAWRFFTSGQFTQLRSVSADWREGREATPVPDGATAVIEVWEILYYVTEIFELAARLALSPAGGESSTIKIGLHGLTNRALVVGMPRYVPFLAPPRSAIPSMEQSATLHRDELVATARDAAAAMAREFFLRFGWTPSLEHLQALQAELEKG
jgi:hypothetical protein